jgi:hypothetical protein
MDLGHNIPEVSHLHTRRRENLISHHESSESIRTASLCFET